ncbi:hypothetical protein GCM10009839_12730 [Catenulispora yoronensis]|uniref:MFS transporter n=1 Tax=Catenulispora yoronensis TaxID=450799 RepID=A0ABP5F743_9ACTN
MLISPAGVAYISQTWGGKGNRFATWGFWVGFGGGVGVGGWRVAAVWGPAAALGVVRVFWAGVAEKYSDVRIIVPGVGG